MGFSVSLSQLLIIKNLDVVTNPNGLAPLKLPFQSTTVISAWHNAEVDGQFILLEPYYYQISDGTWGARCTYEDGSLVRSKSIRIGCMYVNK